MTIDYDCIDKFQKEFDKLNKKYRTLAQDLELAKKGAIELYHLQKIDNHSIFPIPGFCTSEILICKLRKFACRALKGSGSNSGIRIIYAYLPQQSKVVFIEIYYKGDKENEDRERIKEYLKSLKGGE